MTSTTAEARFAGQPTVDDISEICETCTFCRSPSSRFRAIYIIFTLNLLRNFITGRGVLLAQLDSAPNFKVSERFLLQRYFNRDRATIDVSFEWNVAHALFLLLGRTEWPRNGHRQQLLRTPRGEY